MNVRQLLSNRSPCTVELWPMDDRHGREVLVAVAKLALAVSPDGHVALTPAPIRERDVPSGPGPWAGIRYPSDVVDEKPGTDVLLVGSAHPPRDGATQMSVSMQVGTLRKTVQVFGPRTWSAGLTGRLVPGPPAAMSVTPLIWELAWGGHDEVGVLENPAGSGVARDPRTLLGQATPQIEDPDAPLDSRAPRPAGFSAIPAHWSPRAERAGTYDETWRRTRAPLRPRDFDPRHNCCAPAQQWSDTPLRGDEPVAISGATAAARWLFKLPRYAPRFRSLCRGEVRAHDTHLDTFLIDADAGTVELCWRARIPLPRRRGALEHIDVSSSDETPLRDALARAALARAGLLETHG